MESHSKRVLHRCERRYRKIWIFNALFLVCVIVVFGTLQFRWAMKQELEFIGEELDARAHIIDQKIAKISEIVGKASLIVDTYQQYNHHLFALKINEQGLLHEDAFALVLPENPDYVFAKGLLAGWPQAASVEELCLVYPLFFYQLNLHQQYPFIHASYYLSEKNPLWTYFPSSRAPVEADGQVLKTFFDGLYPKSLTLDDYGDEHKGVLLNIYEDPLADDSVIGFSVGIRDQAGVAGRFALELPLSYLESLLQPFEFWNGDLFLICHEHTLISLLHPRRHSSHSGDFSTLTEHEKADLEAHGYVELDSVICFTQALTKGPWHVAFALPKDDLRAYVLASGKGYLLMVIFLISGALVSFMFIFRKFVVSDLEAERVRMEMQIKQAELSVLRSQVNPHFLFNSLNSLRALVEENPLEARNAISQLSNFLRSSLQSGRHLTVPLEEELKCVRAYVELEKLRFEDRLRFQVDVDESLLTMAVPPMTLQHLVENAIKYGVATHRGGGDVLLEISRDEQATYIYVKNTGQLAVTKAEGSTQVGQENVRKRLHILYGEDVDVELYEQEGWVIAHIRIPTSKNYEDT